MQEQRQAGYASARQARHVRVSSRLRARARAQQLVCVP